MLDDEAVARLGKEIQALYRETGCRLFVNTVTFLPTDTSLGTHARKLREAWVGDGLGILVAQVRSGSVTPSLQLSPTIWSHFSEPSVAAVLRRTGSAMAEAKLPGEKLVAGVSALAANVRDLEKERRAGQGGWSRKDLALPLAFLGVMGLGAILTSLAGRWLRQREITRQQTYLLPEVVMPTRLGAPNGGGVVVEISYRA